MERKTIFTRKLLTQKIIKQEKQINKLQDEVTSLNLELKKHINQCNTNKSPIKPSLESILSEFLNERILFTPSSLKVL